MSFRAPVPPADMPANLPPFFAAATKDRRTPSAILDAALTNARRGPTKRGNAIVQAVLAAREVSGPDAAENDLERLGTAEGRF